MAHTYSHFYSISATGLRFLTGYNCSGRPDMAYYNFTKTTLKGKPIDVYNNGEMQLYFIYIDDIVNGLLRTADVHPLLQLSE